MSLTTTQKNEILEGIDKEYDEKIADLEFEVSETKSKLEVTPVEEIKNSIISFDQLKQDRLS